ncbi:polysaccharide deacetylase family protein [Clostridium hydrogenum]|uniref:polysaccharide deacetylase family protein n=1 Tax=Clostridium hydrogenum TaxID=2855764 RepID=UPI002E32793E|nr:polysaccharide deacetylase family protein [Clostridium hydrogenum]
MIKIRKLKKLLIIIITGLILCICGFVLLNYYKDYQRVAYSKEVSSLKNNVYDNSNKKSNNESVPVLMYHSICDDNDDNIMKVPKKQFDEQMKYLKDNGYHTLSANEFYNFLVNGKSIPKKSVLITFDDGYQNQYDNAYPTLKKYNFNAVLFIITNYLDKGTLYLKSSELKEMSQNGIDIECHTLNHAKLDKLSYEDQLKNLEESKNKLEGITGKSVRAIAYPYGEFNVDTVKAEKKDGYLMAFTTSGKWASNSKGLYAINRIYIFPQYNMKNFIDRVTNSNYSLFSQPIKMIKGAYDSFVK